SSTLAGIRSGQPHIQHPPLMMIVDKTDECTRRQFDHDRTFRHIHNAGTVRRIGVECETNLPRASGRDPHRLAILDAELSVAIENAFDRYSRIPEAVCRHRALEIRIVPRTFGCLLCRKAAFELVVLSERSICRERD